MRELSAALIDCVDREEFPRETRSDDEAALLDFLFASATEAETIKRRALFHLFAHTYGEDDRNRLRSRLARFAAQCSRFSELYGDGAIEIIRAPARITILGEHVDYVSYLPTASLTFASREHDMVMLYRVNEELEVRGASSHDDYHSFDFREDDAPLGVQSGETADWQSYLYHRAAPPPHWGNYVKAAVHYARFKCGERIRRGFDFLVDSNIPPKGGASSSSALTVLAGAAIRQANRIAYTAEELARDSGQAEWYVGTRGGAMDHLTICLAERSHAVRISYADDAIQTMPLPRGRHRWITFFSHPADKGREVMLEYNERAAVARLLIPAVIESWKKTRPALHERWRQSVALLSTKTIDAVDALTLLVAELPQTLTLAEAEHQYPEAYRQCQLAFPAMIEERKNCLLPLRDRALHHLGEIQRVHAAENILVEAEAATPALRALGQLLDTSHQSLRDNYGVSTPQVESLMETVMAQPQTLGARLMGGGFGGNVLALAAGAHTAELLEFAQKNFYHAQQRDALGEGAIMISTPGDGLSKIDIEQVWIEALTQFNALGWESNRYRQAICALLDSLYTTADSTVPVWPVIVAAGRGTRARLTGMHTPKPLTLISGQSSILRVLQMMRQATPAFRPPIVIVSPETEAGVKAELSGEEVYFVMQREALGTGDAVLCAQELLESFSGLALIVWSTQPVIRPETVRRTIRLAQLFHQFKMFVPTALKERPYAPLLRDHHGQVQFSRETHLERARTVRFGETNIGLFGVDCQTMLETLRNLRQDFWQEDARRYNRPGGELGFPNEMVNQLSREQSGVLASPIADAREEQGIKNLEDVARCEQNIESLRRETV